MSSKTCSLQALRQKVMGDDLPALVRMAASARHCAAGHRHSLASRRVSPFLDTKELSRRRTPSVRPRIAGVDPQNVDSQCDLGRPTDSQEVLTAARSPWQNAYVERLIGSIRRDCLDHVIVLNEQHLRRVLRSYFQYYHRSRCHLSLDGDAPESRPVQGPEMGRVVELPEVGGLHDRYVRAAA